MLMQIVVRATDPPGEVVEYPIDSIEWGKDSSTGHWYIQFYALPPEATVFFEVKVEDTNQAELSSFHNKILAAIGKIPISVSFEIKGATIPKDFVITVNLATSTPRIIAPSQISNNPI